MEEEEEEEEELLLMPHECGGCPEREGPDPVGPDLDRGEPVSGTPSWTSSRGGGGLRGAQPLRHMGWLLTVLLELIGITLAMTLSPEEPNKQCCRLGGS